jgi:hypothetical protein
VYTVTGGHATNSCTIAKTVTVSALIPNVTVQSSITICEGETATLTASGASSYVWNGVNVQGTGILVVSPTVTTVYPLIATTSSITVNCVSNHTAMVTVNPLPTITIVNTKSVICKGETNTLTATGGTAYVWGTGVTGSGATVTIKPNTTTFFDVTGTDANGCQNTFTIQAKVNPCTSISEIGSALSTLVVYPNPSTGNFQITSEVPAHAVLVNNLGQEVKTFELTEANSFSVSVKELDAGVYFLVGESAEGKFNQRIVIEK